MPKEGKGKIFIARPDMPDSAMSLLKTYDLDVWEEDRVIPKENFLKRIAGKDAIFISSQNKIDKEALDAAGGNLKVISTLSAGLDHIDVDEVKKRGIKIGYTGTVLSDAVAEFAIGLVLACTRRIFEANKQIVTGNWPPWQRWNWMNGRGVKGSVVGIFGLGKIGLEIAKRLVPFKPARILYTSRKETMREVKAERVSLEELLKQSDIVIVSVSLNRETEGIINEEKLNMMKPTSVIVNVSRGSVIDQDALVKALKTKIIRGAALDVMTPEPLPKEHILVSLENCALTPHIGSAENTTRIEMAEMAAKNIIAALTGNPLPLEA